MATSKKTKRNRIQNNLKSYSNRSSNHWSPRIRNFRSNEDDILIVAPYNVQVNYLKSILPKGARVGTIDKFQGQQAPATIISMTTSDPESLPRNVDFFFSRNRLNVAVSRSQCLTIVIMNKKILDIKCNKVEHVKLVNTFMKLLDYEVHSEV